MFRPRSLLLFSVLLFYSAFGYSKNDGKSEISEDVKKDNSRTDAEQDTFTTVTLAAQEGDPHSKLFSTCLTSSRTFEAKFASIEVVGSEYIRYVPDSIQLSYPVHWISVAGSYPSILDCAQAAHDGGWPMFKYNGAKCEVVNATYNLNDVPMCTETKSDAVFILSTAVVAGDCPIPRFFVGYDENNKAVCGLVNKDLMTYDEAKSFCAGVYPDNELSLFVNEHRPLTLQNTTNKFIELGYTNTNLWVDAEETCNTADCWYGNFATTDWWDGQIPAYAGLNVPYRSAYLDKDTNFMLRVSVKSFKAGALCITYALSTSEA